ncbi:hypothetical protein GCM10007860_15720 [Chitiniphilus shinanonensis]|uniref:Alginate export domain-containing protein n=1 Tax=Chitiniphilus shinanonensis TaxID=553088 RepID=A0ABQ6BQX8_9NEIS|nr:hypothetical protein [Chitiniphilus shinanonensis]GLS04425.1 hypothetical protein GCM10007860_15720 [Chitiniphilus shinanonensis]
MPIRSAASGLLALLALGAQAHDSGEAAIPSWPSWRFGAALAGEYLDADPPYPAPTLPGILGNGSRYDDRRGWRLEHATLELAARLTPAFGGHAAVGWHDDGKAHVEEAWFEGNFPLDHTDLAFGAGRDTLPIGAVIERGGHFDRFLTMPLAKRALFDGDWQEGGVNLRWLRSSDEPWPWLRRVDLGMWRSDAFPGDGGDRLFPMLRLGFGRETLLVDAFYAHLEPQARGAFAQGSGAGHVHGSPDCSGTLAQRVCFDGTVDLAGLSGNWATPLPSLALSGALLARREAGSLAAQNGDTRYRGTTWGGWAQAAWQFDARWETALRYEWLEADHTLRGPGATSVARDAGLLDNPGATRFGAMLGWRPWHDWLFSIEAGSEQLADQHTPYVALRAVWQAPELFGGGWPR